MSKNKKELRMDESEVDISELKESSVEEYDLKLEEMKEEVKNLKKIRRRQKKLNELEFAHREILKKMDKDYKKNK